MNRQIRRLGFGLLVCYLALFTQLNWLQVVNRDEYNANPRNNREIVRDYSRARGAVISADGVILAESIPSGDRFEYLRQYPLGDTAGHVTGFFSFNYGTDGVEKVYNDLLAGQTTELRVTGLSDLFSSKINTADVHLTLLAGAQQVAKDALGAQEGSVVALDPRTGAILAMYSFPTYDPNNLASHDFDFVDQTRVLYSLDPAKPLLAHTYRERYFPGSTFKVVTGSAGVESGLVTVDQPSYPVTNQYIPPLTSRPLQNFGGASCGGTLFQILAVSCNTSFAQMGVELGAEIMVAGAEAFGFNEAAPIDLPSPAASRFPEVAFFDENTPALAQSAIGQNEVQATPLQMAMVAAAIVNGGAVMTPHVFDFALDTKGREVERYEPTLWKQALSLVSASIMRDAMIGVVESGTASRLAIPGVVVGGKTGTAQLGTDPPSSHAWIIGFAPAENPRVAVAVLVKAQPGVSEVTGGRVAAPIARAVMEAVLAAPDLSPRPPSRSRWPRSLPRRSWH